MVTTRFILARHHSGKAVFGLGYDDATLIITHVGAVNNTQRTIEASVHDTVSGQTLDREIPPGFEGWRDVSSFGLLMEQGREPVDGDPIADPGDLTTIHPPSRLKWTFKVKRDGL